MSAEVNVIWQRGDGAMPPKAKQVVDQASDELLLRVLQLPNEVVDTIRYNADKNEQSVNSYLSNIVSEQVKIA
jgi:predicted HicB family RNase H-like nuclease